MDDITRVIIIPLGHSGIIQTEGIRMYPDNIRIVSAMSGTCTLHSAHSYWQLLQLAKSDPLLRYLREYPYKQAQTLGVLTETMKRVHAEIVNTVREAADPMEAAINDDFASAIHLGRGTPYTIADRPYTVSRGTNEGTTKMYTPFSATEPFFTSPDLTEYLNGVAAASGVDFPDLNQPLVLYRYINHEGHIFERLLQNVGQEITLPQIIERVTAEIAAPGKLKIFVIDVNCAPIMNAGKQHTRKRKDKNLYRSESIKNRRKSIKNRRKSRKNRRKFNRRR